MLGLVGASLVMPGCDKEDPIPMRDIELRFSDDDCSNLFYRDREGRFFISEIIKTCEKDPYIKTVYLIPEGDWHIYVASSINGFRKYNLEILFDYSSKLRGRGDFNFYPGAASQVPEDSLWYVSKGFTINKYRPLTDYQR